MFKNNKVDLNINPVDGIIMEVFKMFITMWNINFFGNLHLLNKLML